MAKNSCFRKCEKLRKNKDILTVLRKGKKKHTSYFLLYIRPSPKPWSRIAVSVSRKIGKAVTRNHIKRYVREYFRLHKEIFDFPVDIFVVTLPSCVSMDFHDGLRAYLHAVHDYFQNHKKRN